MSGPGRREPLDAAERELAQALAGALPAFGPGADVDERILALARGEAAARTDAAARGQAASVPAAGGAAPPPAHGSAAGHPRRRRTSMAWLRGTAVAATVVVAAGVAWQLRPLDGPETTPHAPGFDAPRIDGRGIEGRVTGERAIQAPSEGTSAAAGARSAAAPRQVTRVPAPGPDAVAAEAAATAVPPPPPAPAPAPAPAPPPAPAAAPTPLRQMPFPVLQALPDEVTRRTGKTAQRDAGESGDAIASEADWLDQPLDDTPPASLDSPAVAEAWLARIRELVAGERYDEARESYTEFLRRHPDADPPPDLHRLLGE